MTKKVTKKPKVSRSKKNASLASLPPVQPDQLIPRNADNEKLPSYEGANVIEILEQNAVGGRFNHCKMSDGTTKHVPIELFE